MTTETRIEAPAFSTGETENGLLFRIDQGKYQYTVFFYDETVYNEESKKLEYTIGFSELVINSIQRDPETMTPEELSDFHALVASPIIEELIEQFNAPQ